MVCLTLQLAPINELEDALFSLQTKIGLDI